MGLNHRNTRIYTIILIFLFSLFMPISDQTASAATVTLTVDTNVDSLINSGCTEMDDDDDCSLRGAISYANSLGGTDIYHIDIPVGVYKLDLVSTPVSEDANQEGDLDITASTVLLHGESMLFTIIDGNSTDRVVDYRNSGGLVTLLTLTIRNGRLESGEGGGAGIRLNDESRMIINSVNLTTNFINGSNGSADSGGGIHAPSANTVTINNSIIQENTGCYGGGFYSYESSVMVQNSSVNHNHAACTNGWGGGFMITSGEKAIIHGSSFTENTAYDGGGLYSSAISLTIEDSTFGFNEVTGNGGGINLGNTATLENVTIRNNTAVLYGGGVAVDYGGYYYDHSDMKNVTIAGNAAGSGGGVAVMNGDENGLNMDHVSFAANTASTVGLAIFAGLNAYVHVANSILAGPDPDGYVCFIVTTSNWTSNGYNITNNTHTDCDLDGAGDMTGTNPMLGTLSDNGGPTWTLPLLEGSPAIDKANAAGCTSSDQRGFYRPLDGDAIPGAICDIGSFEYGSTLPTLFSWLPLIKK
jgi:predicted outer membrane repeat protein